MYGKHASVRFPQVALADIVLRWWFCCCRFVVDCYSHFWDSEIVLCFVVPNFVFILVLQSS